MYLKWKSQRRIIFTVAQLAHLPDKMNLTCPLRFIQVGLNSFVHLMEKFYGANSSIVKGTKSLVNIAVI